MQYGRHDEAIYGTSIEEQIPADKSINDGEYIVSLTRDGKKSNIYMTVDLISSLNHAKKGDVVTAELISDGKTVKRDIILRADVECKTSPRLPKLTTRSA